MRRLIGMVLVGLVVMTACSAGLARASGFDVWDNQPRLGCIVFEDDSFMCGTLDPQGWLDQRHPYITGCIPSDTPTVRSDGGRSCVDDYTDECPPGLEDVECWEATHP